MVSNHNVVGKVAVCLATFNGENFLREQIDSIITQLSPVDCLYISDDGSTDSTLSIIKSYGQSVHLVNDLPQGGVVGNFEFLLKYALDTGYEFVVLSDQDDVWLKGRLDAIRKILLHYDFVMTNGRVVDECLNDKGMDIFEYVSFHDGFLNTFISTKYVGCCMAFKKNILELALPFPKRILWHDWYLALVAQLFFRCTITKSETILFRRHINNLSNTGKKSNKKFIELLKNRFWIIIALLIVVSRYSKVKFNGYVYERN
jgi:glycosyltransferase involved in cell wall biosynthesis